jgi:RNA polymerase sigma-B factor
MIASAADSRAPGGRPGVARPADRGNDLADLRAYARHRDARARERLVRAYLPLARAVARRFAGRGRVPLEDLQQIAAVGLLKALERFDPDHGAAFSSFAVPTMQGEIRRYFRDLTWSVRPPRDLQERVLRVEREREQCTRVAGRNPTAGELAERIGCTIEETIDTLEAAQARGSESLDRPLTSSDDDGVTLGEWLGGEDPGFAAAEATADVDRLLGTLPEREALVVRLRFHEDLTQAEIGKRIGCSQMHVSRVLHAALAQLANRGTTPAPPESGPQREVVLD